MDTVKCVNMDKLKTKTTSGNTGQLRQRKDGRIAKLSFCPVDTGTIFHLALLTNICTFKQTFVGWENYKLIGTILTSN